MRFFHKSPIPEPTPHRVHHPWHPPQAEFPGIVPINTLQFDRSERAAIAIVGISAYTEGFEIFVARCIRPGTPGIDEDPTPDALRGRLTEPQSFQISLQFSDGSKAIGGRSPGDSEPTAVPDALALGWVADVLGSSDIAVLRGLREGGSPWLLRADDRELVLRVGQLADAASFATEVAALRLAARAAIPVPRLLAHDDGTAVGVPLVLTERLPGSSQIPLEPNPARLRTLGAVAARLHAVSLGPSAEMPARDRPIAGEDFAKMRREQKASGLLEEAETLIKRTEPTSNRSVFVHGDLWYGNTLWNDGILTGLVDWDCAGAGAPGVDLGSLRCDAAICYGAQAPMDVLRGWERAAGHAAEDVAYWDVVAALATPPDMGWFPAAISAQGRPDLDRATLLQRRDTFLRHALDRLG